MKIPHWYLLDYLTNWDGDRPQESWDAVAIVKAMKGREFKGYVEVINDGNRRDRYYNGRAPELADLVLTFIGRECVPRIIDESSKLVPIPNSDMIVGSGNNHRIIKSAESLLNGYNSTERKFALTLDSALRWNEVHPPSHTQPGYRSPSAYEGKFSLAGSICGAVYLFDDVYTSGSQAKAAARFLSDAGATVKGIVTAAKTVHQPSAAPIEWRQGECDLSPPSLGLWKIDF